ncbi:MAG: DUF4419 domain-containing protein [Chloroflexi bacterium]|nr:DUF4419 domain-containing protein [Chloroflexota bacterium]
MITFDICDVEIGRSQLGRLPADFVLRGLLGAEIESYSTTAATFVDTRERLQFGDDGVPDNPLLGNYWHPFVEAVAIAFSAHFPLSLSPDHIWLLICQGLATHVNLNAEKLRHHFVQHTGKEALKVEREIWGNSQAEWTGVFEEFAEQVKDHVGDIAEVIGARYSTTSVVEQAAFQMLLLKTVNDYFEYEFYTLCGIPRITLEGTPKDWRDLRRRAAELAQYDLECWINPLLPVLDEFVAASEGFVNTDFWNNIFKWKNESGGPYITGWIGNFFPYIYQRRHRKDNPDVWERVLVPNPFLDKEPPMFGGLKKNILPNSLAQVPFKWFILDFDPIDMLVSAGFVGVSQNPDTLTLRPEIGWAVSRETALVDKALLRQQEALRRLQPPVKD